MEIPYWMGKDIKHLIYLKDFSHVTEQQSDEVYRRAGFPGAFLVGVRSFCCKERLYHIN